MSSWVFVLFYYKIEFLLFILLIKLFSLWSLALSQAVPFPRFHTCFEHFPPSCPINSLGSPGGVPAPAWINQFSKEHGFLLLIFRWYFNGIYKPDVGARWAHGDGGAVAFGISQQLELERCVCWWARARTFLISRSEHIFKAVSSRRCLWFNPTTLTSLSADGNLVLIVWGVFPVCSTPVEPQSGFFSRFMSLLCFLILLKNNVLLDCDSTKTGREFRENYSLEVSVSIPAPQGFICCVRCKRLDFRQAYSWTPDHPCHTQPIFSWWQPDMPVVSTYTLTCGLFP